MNETIEYDDQFMINNIYVMQIQTNQSKTKILESIQKSSQLLKQGKQYEFAQKIKALAQRRQQTGKNQQAAWLLYHGSEEMLKQEQVEINAVNQLISILLQLYEKEKELVVPQTSNLLYKLITMRENPSKIEYFSKIIKSIIPPKHCPEIVQDYLCHYEGIKQFWKIETLVVHLGFTRISAFLQKWRKCIEEDEYSIVTCRMALLKGLFYDFDEPMVLLSELPGSNPFVKFCKFLIQSVQMNSKECFEKIGTNYAKFLQSDQFFLFLYQNYGVKYFKKEKKEAQGLLGMFQ